MFLIMLGGFHIEMTALAAAGKFLNGGGWTDSLVLAGVNSAGKAESLRIESKVKRSRYAHQVTLVCLSNLCVLAYEKYKANNEDHLGFETWGKQRLELPQFKYCSIMIDLQCLILIYVRSVRESDFNLF